MSGLDEDHRPDPGCSQAGGLRRGFQAVIDAIVPPVCVACQSRVQSHDTLCARCWSTIAFIRPPLCHRLGLPLPFGGTGGPLLSAAAAADPPGYDRARAVAVFNHDSVLRRLIHGMKYADRHDARRLFGRWLVSAGAELLADADVIVPVPLTRWRLIRRQFNQSALLAGEVSNLSGVPSDPLLLVKSRTTQPQVGLSRAQRHENVCGAFLVPPARRAQVDGRNLLLLDDVITTGSTVEAATRALRDAGACRVDVLALGLVTDPRQVTV